MRRLFVIVLATALICLPATSQIVDNRSTPSGAEREVQSFPMVFDGANWWMQRGDQTNGIWVNVKTWTANGSVNVAQFGGNAVVTGTGGSGVGIPRVTVANDSTIALLAGSAIVGKVTTDQTTHGTTDLVAADLTKVGGTNVVTGGVAGSQGVGGTDAAGATPAQNPVQLGAYAWTDGSAPTAQAAGKVAPLISDRYGRLLVTSDHPKRFSCPVISSTATALTALGGSCAAPGAGLSIYITDINASSSAATTTTADQQLELKTGTGGTCGSSTSVVWSSFAAAQTPVVAQFITPIKLPANQELCWQANMAGNKTFIVNGYVEP